MPFFKTRFDRSFDQPTQVEYLLTQSSSSSAARCIPSGLLSADNADFRLYELLKSNSRFFRIADENSLAFQPSCLRQRRFSSSRELLVHEALNESWWRMTGSNRRPPACKAGALPAELIPRWKLVGLVGLEPTTPALSRRCSNQLSYRPLFRIEPFS